MDTVTKSFYNLQTSIRRAVIHYNDFLLYPSLRQRAFDGLRNPALSVVAGDEDGNGQRHCICWTRASIESARGMRFSRQVLK